jgi:DNA repair photolyase
MQRLVLVVVFVFVRTLQRCCLWQSIPVRFVTKVELATERANMVSQMDAEGLVTVQIQGL